MTTGRLILVRHGETIANIARELDTLPPGAPLSEEGQRQAAKLGLNLADRPLAALVSSTALRAQQTAKPVSESTARELEVVDGLYEIQAGDLEGRSDRDAHIAFMEVYRKWHLGDLSARVPGGESGQDALDRYLPQIEELRIGHLGADGTGDVVVVSHGAVIRLAAAYMGGLDPLFAGRRHLQNTESVVLAPGESGSWRVEQWGDDHPPFAPLEEPRYPDTNELDEVDGDDEGLDNPVG